MIKVKDNKITNTLLLVIDSYIYEIELIGNIPMDALVTLNLGNYWFPLEYKNTGPEGHLFRGNVSFTENILSTIKNKRLPLFFTVEVNGTSIEGKIHFSINFQKLEAHGKSVLDNDYKNLLIEVNKLKRTLNTYVNKEFTGVPELEKLEDIQPGMVPIALDNQGNFKYDYPFYNIEESLRGLAESVLNLSNSNEKLVERINTLEAQVHEHIHEDIL